jgi:hypothetical protein
MPVGLASDTIVNGVDDVAPMYAPIGIATASGSRIATARTARHISIANFALAVANRGLPSFACCVMWVSAVTNGRIPCMTWEYKVASDDMHCQ